MAMYVFQPFNGNFDLIWLRSDTNGSAVCISVFLIPLILCRFSNREVVLPCIRIVGICKQITFLVHHYVISMLIAPLKFIYSLIQVSGVLVLTVRCRLINFVFQIFSFFNPEVSAGFTSYIVQIIRIYFAWMLYPLQFCLFSLA
jgi:hypothetical protein